MRDWLFLLLGLVLSETAEFAPEVMKRLVKKAVKGLPEEYRDVLEETWLAELDACAGKWSKFIYIFSLIQNRREVIHAIEEAKGTPLAMIWARKFARTFDLIYLWFLLPAVLPLMALISLLIYLETWERPFYVVGQTGLGGRPFGQYMFRTMKKESALILENAFRQNPALRREWELTGRLRHDPRLTRAGRVVQALHLERLPVFINVLRGDMSIVGPMPLPLLRHELRAELIDLYQHVRPGMISGARHEIFVGKPSSLAEWARAERKYQETWSPLGHFSVFTRRFQIRLLVSALQLLRSRNK